MHSAIARGLWPCALAIVCGAATVIGCGPSTPSASCKAMLLPGDLVITEVFADFKAAPGGNSSDAGKEWFEIYNARGQPIDLEGVVVTHGRRDGATTNAHTIGRATIAPGQYFTLGNAPPGAAPPYIDHGYGGDLGDLVNTGDGKLALSCEDREIDSAIYGAVREGHARELTGAQSPDYTLNDDLDSWCQANDSEFEAGNFGTPGSGNDCTPFVAGQCNDGGALRDAVTPGPGDLVITEVMPSPRRADDATGEWFEAKVMTDIDLNGVGLDRTADSMAPDVITSANCIRATAGSHVVFARSADPAVNGGLPAGAIRGIFRFAMVGGAPTTGDAAILAGTTVVDAVRWTRTVEGASLQLDPDLVDPIANDIESNFCNATMTYGNPPSGTADRQDLGTPGVENSQCAALPGEGMCDDGNTIRPIVKPRSGQLVISEFLANPANVAMGSSDAQREWFEIVNIGATAFDLNDLAVGRIGAAGTPLRSARCLPVDPGAYAVLARSADPAANSMLPDVRATFRFGLVDRSGDIQISDGATALDTVRWTSVTSGVSRQLDPRHLSAADNDDAASFCPSTTPYGDLTNKGSPGAANAPCL